MKTPLAIKLESTTPNNNASLSSDDAIAIRAAALASQSWIRTAASADPNDQCADANATATLAALAQIV